MAFPLAMLARLAMAGAEFGAGEASAARVAAGARGSSWRQAMAAAGGNRGIASEMVRQKSADIREQDRMQRQQAMDAAREQARQQRQAMQQGGGPGGGWGGTAPLNAAARVIQDDYRGLAQSVLPAPVSQLVAQVGHLADAIEARGRGLAMYSPDLMQSVVTADVRQMLTDMREARRNGPAYARVIDEQSKLQTTLQAAFLPIKEDLAKIVGDILKFLNDNKALIQTGADFLHEQILIIRFLLEQIARTARMGMPVMFALADWLKHLAEEEQKKKKNPGDEPNLEEMWKNPILQLPPENPPPVPPVGNGRLGLGVFDGL